MRLKRFNIGPPNVSRMRVPCHKTFSTSKPKMFIELFSVSDLLFPAHSCSYRVQHLFHFSDYRNQAVTRFCPAIRR